MIPPASPFCLIQEGLYPDRWLCLVACMMLNCTTRRQVERVLPEFRRRWPTPHDFILAGEEEVTQVIRSLGFGHRRAKNLLDMTADYLTPGWKSARELHGIGEYAARSDEMFFGNSLGDEPPKDHALVKVWEWRHRHNDFRINVKNTEGENGQQKT